MAINEQIVTGRKFRKLIDAANKKWQRISFWTKAGDVEFNDGKTAEEKLGTINGITSDLSCEEPTIAASAAALNQVNRNFSDACNTIKAAIIGKGVTPSSSKPTDLADAINKISAKGTLTKIATATVSTTKFNTGDLKTISLKSYNNYLSLSIKDILISCTRTNITQNTYAYVGSTSVSKHSYNAANGTLTVQVVNAVQKETGVTPTISFSLSVYVIE